jgi:hypothetical protein
MLLLPLATFSLASKPNYSNKSSLYLT